MKIFSKALLAAAGALVAIAPAHAEAVVVTYRDLDLATPEGQKELDKRIEAAARKACGFNELSVGSRIATREARECVADARGKIEKRVATLTDKKTAGS